MKQKIHVRLKTFIEFHFIAYYIDMFGGKKQRKLHVKNLYSLALNFEALKLKS